MYFLLHLFRPITIFFTITLLSFPSLPYALSFYIYLIRFQFLFHLSRRFVSDGVGSTLRIPTSGGGNSRLPTNAFHHNLALVTQIPGTSITYSHLCTCVISASPSHLNSTLLTLCHSRSSDCSVLSPVSGLLSLKPVLVPIDPPGMCLCLCSLSHICLFVPELVEYVRGTCIWNLCIAGLGISKFEYRYTEILKLFSVIF